jgi:hypothetical protein
MLDELAPELLFGSVRMGTPKAGEREIPCHVAHLHRKLQAFQSAQSTLNRELDGCRASVSVKHRHRASIASR